MLSGVGCKDFFLKKSVLALLKFEFHMSSFSEPLKEKSSEMLPQEGLSCNVFAKCFWERM